LAGGHGNETAKEAIHEEGGDDAATHKGKRSFRRKRGRPSTKIDRQKNDELLANSPQNLTKGKVRISERKRVIKKKKRCLHLQEKAHVPMKRSTSHLCRRRRPEKMEWRGGDRE